MRHFYILILAVALFGISSCKKDETPPPRPNPENNVRTVFLYFPWTENLTSYFYRNIQDVQTAISQNILKDERVIVYINKNSSEATMFEIKYAGKNGVVRDTLKTFRDHPFTTEEGITALLNEVKGFAPAKRYSMIIGSHGMAWIPVKRSTRGEPVKEYWEYEAEGVPLTRWFGGVTANYQTDIETFAAGIKAAGIKMEYIMFDDCYMSSIEVAYQMKDVTDYLIGCPTEIMAYGMPYDKMFPHLIGTIDYKSVTDVFYAFYSTYQVKPCGTIGVTDCSQVDKMASVMKRINSSHTFEEALRGEVQVMDGYPPTRFFDYGDYVAKLCDDESLLREFEAQLEKTVPYKAHTEYFYTMRSGEIKIDTFSGIMTSDPTIDQDLLPVIEDTAWYKATH